jgi:membrane associated rhomboid family serine protease
MNKSSQSLWSDLGLGLFIASLPLLAYILFISTGFDQRALGVRPGELHYSWGIFTCPFAHANWSHILSNSGSLYLFFAILFSLYRKFAGRVTLMLWLLTGLFMFLFARSGDVHIGASGVVYALAAYLVIAGLLSGSRKRQNVAYLVIIYFGSMVWGLLPYDSHISWDGHLCGAVAGAITAVVFMGQSRREYADVLPEWFADEDEKRDEYARFSSDKPKSSLKQ